MEDPGAPGIRPVCDRVLVVMAKAPRLGAVKTRLSPSIPPYAATGFYRCLLQDTLALAGSLAGIETAIVCPAADAGELKQLAGDAATVIAQQGEGLAAGLRSAFAHFSGDPGRKTTIAFNSDSPHLPRSILEGAFETLTEYDLVVGPTHDGGYYLVGAKASYPQLFTSDSLGTSSALDALLSRARSRALSVGFAPPFYDIDLPADLTCLCAELQQTPARAPRTAAWLKRCSPLAEAPGPGVGKV